MAPILGLTALFVPLEAVCIYFIWNTAGEVLASVAAMLIAFGNGIVLASALLKRRRLTAALLAMLVLLACPYPIWLQSKHMMLESEARRVIAYADGVKQQTGAYPPDLSAYQFRLSWTSRSILYHPDGYYLRWWAFQPGVSHSYSPAGGFHYYPD